MPVLLLPGWKPVRLRWRPARPACRWVPHRCELEVLVQIQIRRRVKEQISRIGRGRSRGASIEQTRVDARLSDQFAAVIVSPINALWFADERGADRSACAEGCELTREPDKR